MSVRARASALQNPCRADAATGFFATTPVSTWPRPALRAPRRRRPTSSRPSSAGTAARWPAAAVSAPGSRRPPRRSPQSLRPARWNTPAAGRPVEVDGGHLAGAHGFHRRRRRPCRRPGPATSSGRTCRPTSEPGARAPTGWPGAGRCRSRLAGHGLGVFADRAHAAGLAQVGGEEGLRRRSGRWAGRARSPARLVARLFDGGHDGLRAGVIRIGGHEASAVTLPKHVGFGDLGAALLRGLDGAHHEVGLGLRRPAVPAEGSGGSSVDRRRGVQAHTLCSETMGSEFRSPKPGRLSENPMAETRGGTCRVFKESIHSQGEDGRSRPANGSHAARCGSCRAAQPGSPLAASPPTSSASGQSLAAEQADGAAAWLSARTTKLTVVRAYNFEHAARIDSPPPATGGSGRRGSRWTGRRRRPRDSARRARPFSPR